MEDDNNKAQSQQNSARNSSTKITSAKGSSTNSGVVSRHESTQNLSKPAPKQTQETAPVNAVIYENTFKLKPDHKFSSESVQKIVQEIMQNTLKTLVYDAAKATGIATLLSQEILEAVKSCFFLT